MNLKDILRTLLWGELFLVVAVIVTPLLVREMTTFVGKTVYALEVLVAMGVAILLRRALSGLTRL